jgi:hypothetical protein
MELGTDDEKALTKALEISTVLKMSLELDFDVFGRISKDDFQWCIFLTIIYTFRKKPQN